MKNCLFCKIIRGDIPATIVHEDKNTVAFNDINPQAPHHILVIPREHYAGIHEIPPEKHTLLAQLFTAVSNLVSQKGFHEKGYRLVVNFGSQGGQEVPHIHIHLLAGRSMQWPPG